MNPKHLGDSYDVVKQALLRALATLGDWEAHPMFTAHFPEAEATAFCRLLGIDLLSYAVLDQNTDRRAYLAPAAASCKHLFLDPDRGIHVKVTRGKDAPAYLFGQELVDIAQRREDRLTFVFDQALARGKELAGLRAKLDWLRGKGVFAVAYQSHASFVVAGRDAGLVKEALEALRRRAHIPEHRCVER